MPLWGKIDNANNAPKFITNAGNGNTGITDYSGEILFVTGNEGYPVPPGWSRKYTKGSRTIWESLVSFSSSINTADSGAILLQWDTNSNSDVGLQWDDDNGIAQDIEWDF